MINNRKEQKVDDNRIDNVEQIGIRMKQLKKEKSEIDKEYYKQIKGIEKKKKDLLYE